MSTYHLLIESFGGYGAPSTDCRGEEGCPVYAYVTCIRCYEHFCTRHSTGTLKTVSYGTVFLPLCLNCITPQEQEANATNTAT